MPIFGQPSPLEADIGEHQLIVNQDTTDNRISNKK